MTAILLLIAFLEWLIGWLWAFFVDTPEVWAQPVGPVIPILEFLSR